jgi:pentapeptide MXKDX repeat protein
MKKSNIKKLILLASVFGAFGLAAYGAMNAKTDDAQVLRDPSTRSSVVSKDALSKDALSKDALSKDALSKDALSKDSLGAGIL